MRRIPKRNSCLPIFSNFYSVVSKCCAGLKRVCDKSLCLETQLIESTVTGFVPGSGSPLLAASLSLPLLPWWPGSVLRDAAGGTGPGTDSLCLPTAVPLQWLSSTSCGSAGGAELFGSRFSSFWKFSFLRKHQITYLCAQLFLFTLLIGAKYQMEMYISGFVYHNTVVCESGAIRGRWQQSVIYHGDKSVNRI